MQRDDRAATPDARARARARVDAGRCAGRRGFPGNENRRRRRLSPACDDNYHVIISRSSSALGGTREMRARRRDSRNAIREGGRTGVARFSAGLRILAHTHTRARARGARGGLLAASQRREARRSRREMPESDVSQSG